MKCDTLCICRSNNGRRARWPPRRDTEGGRPREWRWVVGEGEEAEELEGSLATLKSSLSSLSLSCFARSFARSLALSLALEATRVHLIATPTETRIDTTHCSGNSPDFRARFRIWQLVASLVQIACGRASKVDAATRRDQARCVAAPLGENFRTHRSLRSATLE